MPRLSPRPRLVFRFGLPWAVAAALLAPAGTAAASTRAPVTVTMTDLGTLGGNYSYATALNDRGQIVGSSTLPDGSSHGYLWERGRMTDLGTFGGSSSLANGINDRGQVVGQAMLPDGSWRAFRWERGRMTDLGTLGGSFSAARAVNEHGDVIGESTTALDHVHAFLWRNGVMTDLTPDRLIAYSQAINDDGDVVGYAYNGLGRTDGFRWRHGVRTVLPSSPLRASSAVDINARGEVIGGAAVSDLVGSHAYLWTPDNHPVDLGTLGGRQSAGHAINGPGEAVGSSQTATGENHAFLWSGGAMADLGVLGAGDESIAADVNDCGQVVGRSNVAPVVVGQPGYLHAVLWQHGTMTDLGTGPGLSAAATHINERGWIIGESYAQYARGVLWRVG